MEEDRKSESGSLKRRHFRRLHEKIQNKYNEMRMKLDKSKSLNSIASLNDDFDYRDPKYSSELDLRIADEKFSEIESVVTRRGITYSVSEDTAKMQEINYHEAILEADSTPSPGMETNSCDTDSIFFNNNFKTSLESLNDVPEQRIAEEESLPPTPSPKISIRDRIGSRLTAAKEKRRREEKEKNANKDKRKNSGGGDIVEKYIFSNTIIQEVVKKKQKVATVTIALIKATLQENEFPFEEKPRSCRFRLGSEKRKSKSVKGNSSAIRWQELFNINMYDDHMLEISIWEGSTFLGRTLVDLSEVEKEKTQQMTLNVVEGTVDIQIFVLLTISGTTLSSTFVDPDDCHEIENRLASVENKYAWYRLRDKFSDVGWLDVIIYEAKGLSANECYCVVELGNERLQTLTDCKTNDPKWMKIFGFAVTDATSILEVTVVDEKRYEDVGKISIPLLSINNGQKKWFALKDSAQRDRAKGANPRILLEMRFTWNIVKASVRVINPKELKHLKSETKFDRQTLTRNWSRAKAVWNWSVDAFKVTKTCFEWESKKLNFVALTIWLMFWWFFKAWMLPLLLLIPFLWYRRKEYFLFPWKEYVVKKYITLEKTEEKEEKSTSLRQKINSLQEIVQTVQNTIGKFASLGESVKNLFNFTVPFISVLTIFFIIIITYVMYLIPFNYILMLWGIQKCARKILRPNRIPNSEILDLLSRVPDDETLLNCVELPLQVLTDDEL